MANLANQIDRIYEYMSEQFYSISTMRSETKHDSNFILLPLKLTQCDTVSPSLGKSNF